MRPSLESNSRGKEGRGFKIKYHINDKIGRKK
jgi:hypothetical protein